MKTVYVVCENTDYGNGIIGIYKSEKEANKKHAESTTWRYIEVHEVNE